MGAYTLTATLDGVRRRSTIYADPRCALGESFDATATAVARIMKKAQTDDVWARGRIVLKDSRGNVVHEMDAKPAED